MGGLLARWVILGGLGGLLGCAPSADDGAEMMDSAAAGWTSTESSDHSPTGSGSATGGSDGADAACAAMGGEFGVVASHRLDLESFEDRWLRAPGIAVGPDGVRMSFVAAEHVDDRDPPGYTMVANFDGTLRELPSTVDGAWAGGRWWPGDAAVLVTHCEGDAPGWTFLDAGAEPISPSQQQPWSPIGCLRAPSAAWVSRTDALVVWIDSSEGCVESAICARAMLTSPQSQGSAVELFEASLNWGASVSVAAGPSGAMVAMVRAKAEAELVIRPVGIDGFPDEPASVILLPPSPEPGDLLETMDAQVVPDEGDGFYVFVGGWGFTTGRLHLDAAGEILEPLTALPLVLEPNVWSIYDSEFRGMFPRPGGWIGLGRAVSGGAGHTLLTAFSPSGDLVGSVLLWSDEVATATDGERLFAVTLENDRSLHELGCVVP